MRNRKIQRQVRKLTENGVQRENIRIIYEQQPKKRCDMDTKYGPVVDETAWQAIQTGSRIVVIR